MIHEATQKKLIAKILESQEFCNSSIYGNYLNYLIKASNEDKNLKETTIAIEFFSKDAEFNPAEDTIVRSHTYKLRKKLESYYFTEGKDEKYRVRIPKGHYKVSIVQVTDLSLSPKRILGALLKHYPILIIIFLLFAIGWIFLENNDLKNHLEKYQIIEKDDFIWKEYLQSSLPILIIPGDHFMFNYYDDHFNRNISIRDVTINSQDDFEKLQNNYPDISMQLAPEPYFPYHSIWSLPPILNILYSANQSPILRKSSSINPQILNEYNIIFVGSIKTLYTLQHTLTRSNLSYQIAPHRVTFDHPDSSSVKEYSTNLHSSGPNEDLVVVMKLPGPADNFIFIIASYHSLGAPEIANYLTDKDSREELSSLFEAKYNRQPKYFEMLFRVVGIDKTAYSREVLVINEIVTE